MKLDTAVTMIKQLEGFRAAVYKDAAGIPTIGYGATLWNGKPVAVRQEPITEVQAANQLEIDVRKFAIGIENLVTVTLGENQLNALVVLAYNIGIGNFEKSSVLKAINEGDSNDTIESKWRLWCKARVTSGTGTSYQTLPGLVRRRAAEFALYVTPDVSSEPAHAG